jgi:hypothetical protein
MSSSMEKHCRKIAIKMFGNKNIEMNPNIVFYRAYILGKLLVKVTHKLAFKTGDILRDII